MHAPFSINEGGPFHRLIDRLGLIRSTGTVLVRRWWVVVIAVAWLPLVLGALLCLVFGVPPDPVARDISVHARFGLALPLLFAASHLLEPQCRGAVHQLYDGKLADPVALDRVIERAGRLRDSAWIEGALVIIAVTLGQLALWGVTGPTGFIHGTSHAVWSFSRVWYAVISLPLMQFLTLRWIWRWTVWNYVLARVSRLPLAATATHPDHAGGLSFLSWPLGGFTWFVAAFATVFAGAWGTQLLEHHVTVPSLVPTLVAFLVLAVVIGCAPLLLFCSHVYRARRRDLASYGLFNLDYVRQFGAKWIGGHSDAPVLGAPDIQSLNDLGAAYQVIVTTRVWVFSAQRLRTIVLAVLIPMLPLLATTVSVETALKRMFGVVLGGF